MYSESSKLLYAEISKIAEAAIDEELLFKESGIFSGVRRVAGKAWEFLNTPIHISFGKKPTTVSTAKPVSQGVPKVKSTSKVKKSKAEIKKEKEIEQFRRAVIEEASGGKNSKIPMWPFIVGGGALFMAPIVYSLMKKKKQTAEEYPFPYKTSALPEILAGVAIGSIPAYVLGSAKKDKEVARAHYLGYGSGLATGIAAPEVVKKIEKMQKILNVLEGEQNE
jgi:hypothetical protein